MRNIVKYVFVFFGLLFLSNFFFLEKTYAALPCYMGCDCGCNTATNTCKLCTCPSSCLCGCYSGTTSCKEQTNVNTCECGGTLCGGCNPVYTDEASCTCGYWTKCKGCKFYDVSGCFLGGDKCSGECSDLPDETCSLYSCDPGLTAIWNPVTESCVCARTTTECNGTGYTKCGSICCPPGTYCGKDSSGNDVCIAYELPEPPVPGVNTAPTAPTQLQTEGISNPQTVTDTTPEFSAIFNDPDTGDTSNYYQIQVNTKSDFTGTVMWNSNKTSMTSTSNGSRSPQISYAGTEFPQVGKKIYYWRIKFWDAGGLESPWSSGSPWFIMCINIDCDPTQYCEDAGWTSAPLTSESILLEDVVKCTAVINCQNVVRYGDCYEDPGIECTKDTDCDTGECCRGYTCTTDCTPAVSCTTDSECGADKCCTGGECGECITPDTQSLRVTIGSKVSNTVILSLWDRILAVLRKLNTYMY